LFDGYYLSLRDALDSPRSSVITLLTFTRFLYLSCDAAAFARPARCPRLPPLHRGYTTTTPLPLHRFPSAAPRYRYSTRSSTARFSFWFFAPSHLLDCPPAFHHLVICLLVVRTATGSHIVSWVALLWFPTTPTLCRYVSDLTALPRTPNTIGGCDVIPHFPLPARPRFIAHAHDAYTTPFCPFLPRTSKLCLRAALRHHAARLPTIAAGDAANGTLPRRDAALLPLLAFCWHYMRTSR